MPVPVSVPVSVPEPVPVSVPVSVPDETDTETGTGTETETGTDTESESESELKNDGARAVQARISPPHSPGVTRATRAVTPIKKTCTLVELWGIEPQTSALPVRRSPS